MIRKLSILLVLSWFCSCHVANDKEVKKAEKLSTLIGRYEGRMVCGDCPGIATGLILNKDNTFEVHMEYLERNRSTQETGKWKIFHDTILSLHGSESGQWQFHILKNGDLHEMDGDGKDIPAGVSKDLSRVADAEAK